MSLYDYKASKEIADLKAKLAEAENRLANMLCPKDLKNSGLYAVGTCLHCLGIGQEAELEVLKEKFRDAKKDIENVMATTYLHECSDKTYHRLALNEKALEALKKWREVEWK